MDEMKHAGVNIVPHSKVCCSHFVSRFFSSFRLLMLPSHLISFSKFLLVHFKVMVLQKFCQMSTVCFGLLGGMLMLMIYSLTKL